MAEFTMPSLGADMDEGTVIEWLVKPGDTVRAGDIVAVVDTAKAAVEVETFVPGTIEAILVEPGRRVPVGTPLALIRSDTDAPAEAAASEPRQPQPAAVAAPSRAEPGSKPRATPPVRRHAEDLGVDLATVAGTGKRGQITRADVDRTAAARSARTARPAVPISPYARRLAAELGVDPGTVTGTGEGGAIRAGDIRAAAKAVPRPAGTAERVAAGEPTVAPATTPATTAERRDAMRAAIARLMARSKREIPHYYLSTTVDMSASLTWMTDRNRELAVSERLVPAALLLKATALAVQRRPELNGFWVDDGFVPAESIDLGVAISLRGGGLVTPSIHAADQLPLAELMRRLKDMVGRARSSRLRRSELADPSITVTNLGDQGVERVYGVIYPPQIALVGVGRIIDRPWAADGMVGARPGVTLTLSADHRATDGFAGGRFLATIDRLLQTPEAL